MRERKGRERDRKGMNMLEKHGRKCRIHLNGTQGYLVRGGEGIVDESCGRRRDDIMKSMKEKL